MDGSAPTAAPESVVYRRHFAAPWMRGKGSPKAAAQRAALDPQVPYSAPLPARPGPPYIGSPLNNERR